MQPDPAGPPDPEHGGLVRTVAPHASPAFSDAIELCEHTMALGHGVHHLAYYSSGVFQYGFDLHGDPEPDDAEAYVNAGRRLAFAVKGLDRRLAEVSTGGLIRTVLHGEAAAVFCHSVQPGEHLVAVTRAPAPPGSVLPEIPGVRAADRTIADLVTALREHVSLSTQNPGGWLTERPAGRPPEPPASEHGATKVRGQADHPYVERLMEVIEPSILPYVAYHRGGEEVSVDHFDHPAVARYFGHVTPAARRRFYSQWGRRFPQVAGDLIQVIRKVSGGPLLRVVLDVEQGAVYYFRLSPGEHLFGVTLDQSEVATADDRMGRLAANLAS
jgi:hypothetical protein